MKPDNCRAEFEAWCGNNDFPVDRNGDKYLVDATQCAWEGWQAREAEIQALRDALKFYLADNLGYTAWIDRMRDDLGGVADKALKAKPTPQDGGGDA